MPPRLRQLVLVVSTLVACWLGMMIVHELGHVIHARWTGGSVQRVVIHPLRFSRTDVDPNPRPVVVAGGGFAWGVALPIAAWLACRSTRWLGEFRFLVRFFAGFCLVANGAYLASAALATVGDTADLARRGVPVWIMVVAGVVLLSAGLFTWNGQGAAFGFGHDAPREGVSLRAAWIALITSVGLTCGTLVYSVVTGAR